MDFENLVSEECKTVTCATLRINFFNYFFHNFYTHLQIFNKRHGNSIWSGKGLNMIGEQGFLSLGF